MGEFRQASEGSIISVLVNIWFRGVFVRKLKVILLSLVALSILVAGPAQAGKALDRLNVFLASKGAIKASFVQTVTGAAFSQPKESRGTFLMQRPGKFRWDYQTPYKQLILADGKRLWIFEPDLDQVVVKPLDVALGDTPALLLSGKGLNDEGSLEERFNITESAEAREGLYWVTLLPRNQETGFQEVRLGFGQKHLRRMELVDGFGQLTTLEFLGMQSNADVPKGSFEFIPPKGVDVIGNPDLVSGN